LLGTLVILLGSTLYISGEVFDILLVTADVLLAAIELVF
jgi:hypothetical protein